MSYNECGVQEREVSVINRFGREIIYTDYESVNESNLIDVLQYAISIHEVNSSDINYLYQYYKGRQPILQKQNEVREEINNTVVVNHANEIVNFFTGYCMGEPISYIARTSATEELGILNEYMFAEDKAACDTDMAVWFLICGTSYRLTLPDFDREDEAPFEIYSLDPRDTFVVYWSGVSHKPVMGVKYVTKQNGDKVYSVYTKDMYYEVLNGMQVIRAERHILGDIPIIEYPANNARLGVYEIVLPLLDSINKETSLRLDAVEQFVQAYMLFKGVDIDDPTFEQFKKLGAIKVPVDGDVKFITQELNQSQNEIFVEHLYDTILTIVGMPNRNMNATSTSDTGSSVILRNGWSDAEARAKNIEQMFKRSEKQFLKLVIRICNTLRNTDLKLSDIEIRFTRRNYENITAKANVLVAMLNNDKIHPKLAFEHCGMFIDPELAYVMSAEYEKEQTKELYAEVDDYVRRSDEE